MLSTKPFYRFFGIVTIVALLSVNLFAQDKAVPTQYASFLDAINAPYAWSLGFTGQNVAVGVIDDSVNMSHPFFSSNIDTASAYNFGIVYNDEVYRELMPTMPIQSATDTSAVWDKADIKKDQLPGTSMSSNDYHGTCVTGCIAAYDSETNTYGPAYGATIVPIRVDFTCQSFDLHLPDRPLVGEHTVAQAIAYNNSAIDIKNNSYGYGIGFYILDSESKISAIADARANNTILLYSSGNERNKRLYPNGKDCNKKIFPSHPYTIAVGATGKNDTTDYTGFAKFSNYGACVFICAPGVGIQTSDREDVLAGNVFTYKDYEFVSNYDYQGAAVGNMYASFEGTSAACPIASGALALAIDAYKTTYPNQVCDVRFIKHLLARTSTKIDLEATNRHDAWITNAAGLSFSPTYGFGQINAKGLIDAIINPETTLGGKFDTVTPQTVATIDWSTMEVTPAEMLAYQSTLKEDSISLNNYYITTHEASQNDALAAAQEYYSSTAAYVTDDYFQTMEAENKLLYSESKTITDETFLNAGIIKQDLEEVVITLSVKADDPSVGFDARYMEVILEHNGLESVLVFYDPNSIKENINDLTWSFTSNVYWGEDPAGVWTVKVYDHGAEDTFTVSDVYSTFYMGAMRNSAVPEPSAWALMALGIVVLFLRKRVRSEE